VSHYDCGGCYEEDTLFFDEEESCVQCDACGRQYDPTLFTAAELGLDPEDDDLRRFGPNA